MFENFQSKQKNWSLRKLYIDRVLQLCIYSRTLFIASLRINEQAVLYMKYDKSMPKKRSI